MKLTYSEIAAFCRSLALLLHAGIGAADGVFVLAEEETGNLKTVLQAMGAALDEGSPLSDAMAATCAFPNSATAMVSVAEETGRLEEVLASLAQFYDRRSHSRRRIKNALTYPSLVLALMLVVVGVLLVKVLPIFDDVYASLGSGLTGVAAVLLGLGRRLKAALPVLYALPAAAVLAVLLYRFCAPLRSRADRWYADRFGDRGVTALYNNAHFAQALALGLGSGLPLEAAAEYAGQLMTDSAGAMQRYTRFRSAVCSGTALPEALKDAAFLPPAECRMLAVALRQGSGDRVMAEIAARLMEQADEALENTVAKIEPAMVLLASLLVGAILLSVMLPLMNIMAAIG